MTAFSPTRPCRAMAHRMLSPELEVEHVCRATASALGVSPMNVILLVLLVLLLFGGGGGYYYGGPAVGGGIGGLLLLLLVLWLLFGNRRTV